MKENKWCPILTSGDDEYGFECMKDKCEWWASLPQESTNEEVIEDCVVKLLLEIIKWKE